jgi:AhpD family alkylhydroperoxidase
MRQSPPGNTPLGIGEDRVSVAIASHSRTMQDGPFHGGNHSSLKDCKRANPVMTLQASVFSRRWASLCRLSSRLSLESIVGRADGAIPPKYREFIAVAVAYKTQYPYCIEAHAKAARAAGGDAQGAC